jgi:glycosyltransferase involved in cell wall biosynthesis
MHKPYFSVVIPTYNRGNYISATLKSVLAQTFNDYEIIVVDDGSTDNTADLIKKIKDSRIKYIYQTNRERGTARNTGVKNSAGTYITFADSDDHLLPHHFETAERFLLKNNSPQICCTSYRIVNDHKSIDIIHKGNINLKLITGNWLSCIGIFLRHDTAIKFPFSEDISLSGIEDWELWLRIAAHHEILPISEITCELIQHDERSVMQTNPDKLEKRFQTFQHLIQSNDSIRHYYKGKINALNASCETYMALHLALTGKNKLLAIKHLIKGFAYKPDTLFTRRFFAILKHLMLP